MLVALVQQRGHLVTKDELLTRLWPGTFVEEGSLNVCVSALRKALGEDARRPTYIETVARSGYRFIAAVDAIRPVRRHSHRVRGRDRRTLRACGPRPVSPVV